MRPDTLAVAAERLRDGETLEKTLAEFLDAFYGAPDGGSAARMVADEPAETGDARHDALLAAVADYLSMQYTDSRPPKWTSAPKRMLARPWFTTPSDAPAMREYLAWASPAGFKRHNIFTEPQPLRRKMSERVCWISRAAAE